MRRFTSTEVGALIFAGLFFFGGLAGAVYPKEMKVRHATHDPVSDMPGGYIEEVPKGRARFYGVMTMLLGAGLTVFVIFPKKR